MAGPACDDQALAKARRAFARQMLASAGIDSDPPLEQAFATVARERYLGPPPWRMTAGGGFRLVSSHDPIRLYEDELVVLAPERGINNGSPSLHARWLHQAAVRPGDRVAHIGAGTGYYTALLAELVGREGHVLAVELGSVLAGLARDNLAHLPQVTVIEGDGADWPKAGVDLVYVNFLIPRPADAWINHLNPDGRLILPLGVTAGRCGWRGQGAYGAALMIRRRPKGFAAIWLGSVSFVAGEGVLARPPEGSDALRAALRKGGEQRIRSLVWGQPASPERCWLVGNGWALSRDEPD